MFAIVTEMMASVNSASGSSHKTHSIRCLLFTFRSPKLRKNCLSNTDLKPLNAQSLSLLLFSINILSMPMSLEQVVPGGDRKIYHQKPEWLLISQCFSFIEEMLPLEASKGLQEKPSLAMVFTRRCWIEELAVGAVQGCQFWRGWKRTENPLNCKHTSREWKVQYLYIKKKNSKRKHFYITLIKRTDLKPSICRVYFFFFL